MNLYDVERVRNYLKSTFEELKNIEYELIKRQSYIEEEIRKAEESENHSHVEKMKFLLSDERIHHKMKAIEHVTDIVNRCIDDREISDNVCFLVLEMGLREISRW